MRGPLNMISAALRALGLSRKRSGSDDQPWMLDPETLAESVVTLRQMLEEIEELAQDLPADARPIGEAARSLVQQSIDECAAPLVDGRRLARDMQQVGQLALAMRERLLLSPWHRPAPMRN